MRLPHICSRQFCRPKEKPQLHRRRLRAVRPVNAIPLDVGGEPLADGALGGIGRIGGAHHFAQALDGVRAVQGPHDNRPLGHDLAQAAIERALLMYRVETPCLRFREPCHAQAHNLKAGLLNHGQDFSGLPGSDSIGLNNGKRTFDTHKRLCTFTPKSAGVGQTVIPASSMALILSDALPLPPAIIAPACPIRRPGGAVCPATNPITGLVTFALIYAAAVSSALPPISPIMMMACVSGSALNSSSASRNVVPMMGSPPIPMQVDWPIPSLVNCPTAS